jgi:hypothetical protein
MGREDDFAEEIDMVGDEENPAGVQQINPLKGLLDASSTPENSPAGDADAPAPG